MARRPQSPIIRSRASAASRKATGSPITVHTSLYLPGPVYETLRKIAYDERVKIHDLVIEGIDAALRRRGYPSIESLKVGKKR
jgi:hypothetical protein